MNARDMAATIALFVAVLAANAFVMAYVAAGATR